MARRSGGDGCSSYAALGLTPRQNSSGDKGRLLGISKRGDVYMRTQLIHGAREESINGRSNGVSKCPLTESEVGQLLLEEYTSLRSLYR
jgi:hypothetical protein